MNTIYGIICIIVGVGSILLCSYFRFFVCTQGGLSFPLSLAIMLVSIIAIIYGYVLVTDEYYEKI